MSSYLSSIGNFLYEFCSDQNITTDILTKAVELIKDYKWMQVIHIYRVVLLVGFNIKTSKEFHKFLENCNLYIVDQKAYKDYNLKYMADFMTDMAEYIKPFDGKGACKIPLAKERANFEKNLIKCKSKQQSNRPLLLPVALEVNRPDERRVRELVHEFPVFFGERTKNQSAKSLAENFNATIESLNKGIKKNDITFEIKFRELISNLEKNANVSVGEEDLPMTPNSIGQPHQRSKQRSKPRSKSRSKSVHRRPFQPKPGWGFEQPESEQLESEQLESEQLESEQLESEQLTQEKKRLKQQVRIIGSVRIGSGGGIIYDRGNGPLYCIKSEFPGCFEKEIKAAPEYDRRKTTNLMNTHIQYNFHDGKDFLAKKIGRQAYYFFSNFYLKSRLNTEEENTWFRTQRIIECPQVHKVVEDSSDAPSDDSSDTGNDDVSEIDIL
jgi:hypothetical protein